MNKDMKTFGKHKSNRKDIQVTNNQGNIAKDNRKDRVNNGIKYLYT